MVTTGSRGQAPGRHRDIIDFVSSGQGLTPTPRAGVKGSPVLESPLLLIFPAAMVFAAVTDLFTMTIPNRISIALVLGFLLSAPLLGMPWQAFIIHIATGLAVLLFGILMFSRGWLGGGDAKLLAAAVLWLGYDNLLLYGFLVTFAGGLLASAILVYRSLVPPLWVAGQAWAMRLHDRKSGIPYGIALSAAALWVYPSTSWFVRVVG